MHILSRKNTPLECTFIQLKCLSRIRPMLTAWNCVGRLPVLLQIKSRKHSLAAHSLQYCPEQPKSTKEGRRMQVAFRAFRGNAVSETVCLLHFICLTCVIRGKYFLTEVFLTDLLDLFSALTRFVFSITVLIWWSAPMEGSPPPEWRVFQGGGALPLGCQGSVLSKDWASRVFLGSGEY